MKTPGILALALLVAGTALHACSSGGDESDGASHWLDCEQIADCAAGNECVCGVCTHTCDSSADCRAFEGPELCASEVRMSAACATAPSTGSVCLRGCLSDAECPGALTCLQGACVDGTATRIEPLCTAGEAGCSCGWGPAERLGTVTRGFGVEPIPVVYYPFDVIDDEAGGAVVTWPEQGEDGVQTLHWTRLAPATETWMPAEVLTESPRTPWLGHAGTRVAILDDGWRELDPTSLSWSEPVPMTISGDVVETLGGATYAIALPESQRLVDGIWQPWSNGDAGSPGASVYGVAIDEDGNLGTVLRDDVGGALHAWYFDARARTWRATDALEPSVYAVGRPSFDAGGALHVLFERDEGGPISAGQLLERRRDPITGTWSDAEPVIGGYFVGRTGELFAISQNGEGSPTDFRGRPSIAHFDPDRGTWTEDFLVEDVVHTPLIYDQSVRVRSVSDQVMITWRRCPYSETCAIEWARFDGVSAPSLGDGPVLDSPEHEYFTPVLGKSGAAASAWAPSRNDSAWVGAWYFDPDTGWEDEYVIDTYTLEGSSAVYEPKVVVDRRGYATIVWAVTTDPDTQPADSPADIFASRWACRPSGAP